MTRSTRFRSSISSASSQWMAGAAAGLVSTVVMTGVLVGSERAGFMPGQPPRTIIDRLLPGLNDRTADLVALATHLGYGAAAGIAGSVVLPRRARGRVVRGAAYGLVLWAVGYEVWVPLIQALPPAHRDEPKRVLTMIAGHLVFGSTLALCGATR